ncbi:MAG: RHS repeat-associated core domain-containing protein [Steroidobacteraceae bacterium]
MAEGQVVAIVSRKSTSTNAVYYPLEDSQGSGSVLTNSSGTNLVRQSYNAFGLPRDGADWDGAVPSGDQSTINGISRRGYTGHSMLGSMGLIHMNGRVQDAITGRFLSPDPNVPHPDYTQSYNRYAYVRNNPLSFIDPSGFAEATFMGMGASQAAYASQLLEFCSQDEVNEGQQFYCTDMEAGILSQVLSGYGMMMGNISAINAQITRINVLYQQQQIQNKSLVYKGPDGKEYAIDRAKYEAAVDFIRDSIPKQNAQKNKDKEHYGQLIMADGSIYYGFHDGDPNTLSYWPNEGIRKSMNVHLHPDTPGTEPNRFSDSDKRVARVTDVFIGTMNGDIYVWPKGMPTNDKGIGIQLCVGCAK